MRLLIGVVCALLLVPPAASAAGRCGAHPWCDTSLSPDLLSEKTLDHVRALNDMAEQRGQTLAQMALAWVLRDPRVTTALIGASSVTQLDNSLDALHNLTFSDDELARIDEHAVDAGINIWARSGEA